MHALGPRINVFFTHLMTMLLVLVAIASSFSYYQLSSASPTVDLRISQLSFLRTISRERCDQAYLKFDLTADFQRMWTWNINHMYVYLVAEYVTDSHQRNEVVVWDTILSGKKQGKIERRGQNNKYSLKDHGYGLRGKEVLVKLKYNILPYMGPLFYGEQGQNSFLVPQNYTSKAVIY
ncbi:unnamed protein product [Chondrus crispus]|uniref:Signal peptidase complex subunit 3 n=1 Tax=Chondrus crispus TaxID=2769 RepID=S0F3W6_CHOCR|nr:unnamed protein product [Chondrus crispus]CDF77548.1 unnamed protein product [Chondrus crispus]|eukprot:XP_005717332.1 unnamed protein product [Chondrus crispus]